MHSEKRHFKRIAIQLPGLLEVAGRTSSVNVVDVSIQGVRIEHTNDIPASNSIVCLSFKTSDDSPEITLHGKITHQSAQTEHLEPGQTESGIQLTHISVDDLGNLRRLLLLNSGEQDLDSKELDALLEHISSQAS